MTSEAINQESWELRSETARLLALNVAQIYTGLNEGEASINSLTESFQQLASFCLQIQNMEVDGQPGHTVADIKDIANNISAQVDNAIVAFQFYDRLSQRLGHVQNNLQLLAELISDDNREGWQDLRSKIKGSYTMESEHRMHDAVMSGASIEAALQLFKAELLNRKTDEIELF